MPSSVVALAEKLQVALREDLELRLALRHLLLATPKSSADT